MADFFDTLKQDMEKGADAIKKGWDEFTGSLKMAATDLGKDEKAHLEAENAMYTWADGDVLNYPYWAEEAGEKDTLMRTLATIMMHDDELVSPCNGVIASVDVKDNTIAISLSHELTVAVKVCTSCADFSKDADILVKQGDFVKLGQPLVKFSQKLKAKTKLLLVSPESTADFKNAGYKPTASTGTLEAGTKIISK